MSIYKKLQDVRVKLHATPLEKSGKYGNSTYFELSDFLSLTQTLFSNAGLTGVVSFGREEATLTIHEHEGDGTIVFNSPRAEVALKGCHPIQNEGAIQTYQRRYLWISALEIVENDLINAEAIQEKPQKQKPELSPQMEKIVNYCKELLDANDPAFAAEWVEMTPLQKECAWGYFNSKQKQASKTIIHQSNQQDTNNE